jgi:hypothetical protein
MGELEGRRLWVLLTVREEHKLRVFENRVLKRMFGPKRDGVTGGWRKLPSIIRIIKLWCSLYRYTRRHPRKYIAKP